jgi:hypothetical protein
MVKITKIEHDWRQLGSIERQVRGCKSVVWWAGILQCAGDHGRCHAAVHCEHERTR